MQNTNSRYNLEKVDLETFNEFALNFKAPSSMWNADFMQSKAMAKIYEDKHYDVRPLILYDDKTPIAGGLFCVMPAMKFLRVARCFHGALVDISNYELLKSFTDALVRYFKKDRVISIQIQPNSLIVDENLSNLKSCGYKHEGFYKGYRNGIVRFYFLKDFSNINSEDELWKSYESKTRNLVNKAIKLGVKCEEIDKKDIHIFYNILESTGKRRGFEFQGEDYFKNMLKYFKEKSEPALENKQFQDAMIVMAYIEPEQSIKLLEFQREALMEKGYEFEKNIVLGKNIKKNRNQLNSLKFEIDACEKNIAMIHDISHLGKRIYISGAAFVTFNNEMVYLFSGSYAQFFGFSGSQLIQHYAQHKGMEHGIKKYNYFMTDGKHSGAKDDGILNFKKGFGGYLVELPGEFHINVNKFLGKVLEMRNSF